MIKFELTHLLDYSDDSIITEMRRVALLIDKPKITQRDFDRLSKVSSSHIRRRFGGWEKALVRAGLEDRYSGAIVTERMKSTCGKRRTGEDLISELKRVAEELGLSSYTTQQFNDHSKVHSSTVLRRFGSWTKALMQAGLTPGRGAMRYTEEDYFENILNVWTHYGRQPKYGEMDEPPSRISAGAYEAKWGKWSNALRAFISRMEQDAGSAEDPDAKVQVQVDHPIPDRGRIPNKDDACLATNSRNIRLGLRWDVFHRDRFRCADCGRSPATTIGIELHADHKIPVALGGKTVIDNLRTLCNECNIGKGAKVERVSGTLE